MKNKLNIVFQTHWDREWYYPFEYYRHRLMQVMDRVIEALNNNEINYFVLDGQVAALEDYYEVANEDKIKIVKHLVAIGKIIIGPWYVLGDEFLVNGEGIIRNLEIGIEIAKKNGNCQKIGYLPDTFGHISQMPQILNGFGITDAIIWRGITSESDLIKWVGIDLSSVFTVYLPEGYYQPIVDQEKYLELMKTYLDKISKSSKTKEWLLTNGGDHLMPSQVNIKERINHLHQVFTDVNFESTHYEAYIKKVKQEVSEDLPIYYGELRDNRKIYVLPNVLSTRSYLKIENQLLEDQILGYTEPLMALMYKKDEKEPKRYLTDTWKLLIQNHPHDSICGCSIDEVHREMQIRSLKVKQRLDMLEKGALQHRGLYAYTFHENNANQAIFNDLNQFLLFNPHPYPYSGTVKLQVYLHQELKTFILKDKNGKIYKPVILNQFKGRSFESPTDYSPEFRQVMFYDIVIDVSNFPAFSLKEFSIENGESETLAISQTNWIENDTIRLTIENNQLMMLDKMNNEIYQDVNHFYSSLDNGDEYSYSKPLHDVITKDYKMDNIQIKTSSLEQVLSYQIKLTLPLSLDTNRQGRASDDVINIIDVELSLSKYSKQVLVKTIVTNHAKDHRLRITFPTNELLTNHYSDSAFSIEKRDVREEH